jgi:Flp pilus assembly protein CpaB
VRTTQKRLARPSLRGLLATRRGSLALALSCALVAAGLLLLAMSQYRHAVAGSAKQSTVLVSTAEIQKGSSANAIAAQHLYKVVPVLGSQMSPNAISNAGALVGRVAANTILPGEQLTAADFTLPTSASAGASALLAPTQRAISVTLDEEHGLTDVLQTGDQVDIYGGFDVQLRGSSQGPHQLVRLLIPDATVLKAPGTSGSAQSGNIVLAIESQQVAALAYAADNGKVWLVLRPANAAAPDKDVTTIDTILLGARATAGGTLGNPTIVFQGTASVAGGQ